MASRAKRLEALAALKASRQGGSRIYVRYKYQKLEYMRANMLRPHRMTTLAETSTTKSQKTHTSPLSVAA